MSDRVEWFTVTIPANTPVATPVTVPCVFHEGYVTSVDLIIPPGPNGNLGFFVAAGGSQYIPRTAGSFLVLNDKYIAWHVTNAINSGSWAVTGYNTDVFAHTIQVGFHVNEIVHKLAGSSGEPGQASESLAAALSAQMLPVSTSVDPLSPDFLLATLPAEMAVTS